MRNDGYKILSIIYLSGYLGSKTINRDVVSDLGGRSDSDQALSRLLRLRLIESQKSLARKDDLLSLTYLGRNKLLRRFPRLNFLPRIFLDPGSGAASAPVRRSLGEGGGQDPGSGKLTLVVFNIPESQRKWRDGLRYQLELLGFGRINRSLYLSPHLTVRESRQIWDSVRPSGSIYDSLEGLVLVLPIDGRIFKALEDLAERVGQWWNLEAPAEEYERALASWEAYQNGSKFLNHFVSGLFLDPLLPSGLSGPDFPGHKVWPIAKRLLTQTL